MLSYFFILKVTSQDNYAMTIRADVEYIYSSIGPAFQDSHSTNKA
jgi:hypothetical protein